MRPMNTARKYLTSCVYIDDTNNASIYAIGGNIGLFKQATNIVEKYDIINNTWSQVFTFISMYIYISMYI